MVPANKILTVAYGTFSCTLEGFDDPFSAMTDIAEYFRDLAAEDRFFGAEPPTPDMAMLRTIAESRANRAVEAQPDDGGVVLRPAVAASAVATATAVDLPEADAPTESTLDTQVDAEPDAALTTDALDPSDHVVAPSAEVEAVAAETPAQPAEAPTIDAAKPAVESAPSASFADDSAAAKLARIRDVVAAERETTAGYAEDEAPEEAVLSSETDLSLASAFEEDAFDTEAVAEAEEPEFAEMEEVQAADETVDAPAIEPEVEIDADDAVEAMEAEATETAAEEAISDAEETVEAAAADTAEDHDDEIADDNVADEVAEPAEAADDIEASTPETGAARLLRRIRVRKVRRGEASAIAAADQVDAADADTEEAEAASADAAATAEAEDPIQEQPEIAAADDAEVDELADASDDDDLMAELSAIEAELDRSPKGEAAGTEDISVEAETDEADAPADEEDDAELIAELAAIKDAASSTDEALDDDAVDAEAETAAAAEAAPEADSEAETQLPADRDMERLFAATDSRLSGEDMSRRHANISHLKAAVAARRADGPSIEVAGDDTNAYREDLASTVRPRSGAKAADASDEPRTAPLMLVSEQRVGEEAEATIDERLDQPVAEPVEDAPAAASEGASQPDDFEQFAADLGAVDLPDILEAAAVYSAKVMGKERFSRPRLLHLAAEAVDDMSREDGLRGFGQLLRDGTIRKVSRGEFALGDDSRYAATAERYVG